MWLEHSHKSTKAWQGAVTCVLSVLMGYGERPFLMLKCFNKDSRHFFTTHQASQVVCRFTFFGRDHEIDFER